MTNREFPLFVTIIMLFLCMIPMSAVAQPWSVGYYTPNGSGGAPPLPPTAIEWSGLTHVIYWGGIVHADGTLDLTTQQFTTDGPPLVTAAHANGVKVLLGLLEAPWVGASNTFSPAITSHLSAFVANVMSTVTSYGLDGVDVDWEPGSFLNGTANGTAMNSLLSALRSALGTKFLTAAAIVGDQPFWAGPAQASLDRVSIMTYDLGGTCCSPTYSWFNSPLYGPADQSQWSIDLAVSRYEAAGIPAAKLNIGIPFYGYQWAGSGVTGPRQTLSTVPTIKEFNDQNLTSLVAGGSYNWDSAAQTSYVSYSTGGGQFISYDDPQSVTAKVHYAMSKGLGGWIIWELVGDYFPAQTPNQPLLDSIRIAMVPPVPPVTPPVVTTSLLPNGTQNSPYSTMLTATGGTPPYRWSMIAGCLSAGLTLVPGTGLVSGTPTAAGTSSFTVQVTDANSLTAIQTLPVTIYPRIALIQSIAVAGSGLRSLSARFPSGNAAGDLVIAFVRMSTTSQTVTVTDTAGNAYTDAVSQVQDADGHQVHVFYAKNIVGGAANTVTARFSSTNNHPWLAIYEYSGLSTTRPLDQTAHAQGSGSAPNSGSTAATTSAPELVFAATGLPSSYTGTATAASGYALELQDTGTSRAANEAEVATATGSVAGVFSLSPAANWTAVLATFRGP